MMYRSLVMALLFWPSMPAGAQTPAGSLHVFPIFVDGISNGIAYRSSLKIINVDHGDPSLQCTLTQRHTAAAFIGLNGDRYFSEVFEAGDSPAAVASIALDRFLPWEVLRSTANAPLSVGYATLACSRRAHAEMHISLSDVKNTKLGETSLSPGTQGNSFEFLLNRRDGIRLGFSLINDSDTEGEYTVIARDEFNQEVDRTYDSLRARSQVSRFFDEILRLPANFIGSVEIVGVSGGRSYVAGLQFTGNVFAVVSPIVREAAIGF
jgi:hypothetical protein